MKFHVITLFPEVIDAYARASILGRAQREKKLAVKTYQLRDFVTNKWGKADERPYGGGPGMVLQAEPVVCAVESIQKQLSKTRKRTDVIYHISSKSRAGRLKIIITSAGGKPLTNAYAKKLSKEKNVIIVERTDEPMAGDNPMGRDVRTALNKALQGTAGLPTLGLRQMPRLFSGVYGLGSRDFRPEHTLGAYEFGELRFSLPIASGRRDSTPAGIFKVLGRDRWHRSHRYTITGTNILYPMYWGIKFYVAKNGRAFWIHSRDLPGYPVSHGCIGLYDEEMQQKFYGYPKEPLLLDSKKLYLWFFPDGGDNDKPHMYPEGLPDALIEIK